MKVLEILESSLVVLIGPPGAGKTTFARVHFPADDILCTSQDGTADTLRERLRAGRTTVADGAHVHPDVRRPLAALAREHHCPAVAVVLDLPEAVCRERLRHRLDPPGDLKQVRRQSQMLRQTLHKLPGDGFGTVFVLSTVGEVEETRVVRLPLPVDRRGDHGPFAIIGDVHGCGDELAELLHRLGYAPAAAVTEGPFSFRTVYAHSEGRKAVFVGDLVDRGPRSLDVVQLVRHMVAAGSGLCVPGNHDVKFIRKLRGRPVQVHGPLARTLDEIGALPEALRADLIAQVTAFVEGLPSHLVLAGGNLVVAHAGLREELHGRVSPAVLDCCLYGEVLTMTEDGAPVCRDWTADYRGRARVVYGHTPVSRPLWRHNTVNLDTGCAFGGSLTALRYPEGDFVSVAARRRYAPSG